MASSPPLDRCRRTRRPLPPAFVSRAGASTAQAALARIISIITAGPSPSPPLLPKPGAADHGGSSCSFDPEEASGTVPLAQEPPGIYIDLNLRLGPSTEIGGGSAERDAPAPGSVVEDVSTAVACDGGQRAAGKAPETVPAAAVAGHSVSPAVSAAGTGAAFTVAKSSEAECDSEGENGDSRDVEEEEVFAEQEESKGSGGGGEEGTTTTTTILTSSSSSARGKGRALGREGCLDLLLEAVRQVSGGAFDDDALGAEKLEPAAATAEEEEEKQPAPAAGRTRRPAGGGAREKRRRAAAECWIPFDLYEEETAPIVRSKRGRSQAMPSKYRDCVLEPWRKLPALPRDGRAARP